jgi:hypothetical protein
MKTLICLILAAATLSLTGCFEDDHHQHGDGHDHSHHEGDGHKH